MASVSIGIPCYNSAPSVAKAVESALAQTVDDAEVLVVDDGSTDDSLSILRGFGDRIRLIETDHRGGNHARNQALHAAGGTWMQFLDADDFMLPEKIALQLAEAGDARGIDVLYSPVLIEQERGNGRGPTAEIEPIDTAQDLYSQWIAWHLPQTGGALWRRESLLALGGWNEAMPCCQEHELYLRALMAGLAFRFTPGARTIYRIWSQDTVCRKNPAQLLEVRTELIDRMCDWLQSTGRWRNVHKRTAGRICFEMARGLAIADIEKAVRYHDDRLRKGRIFTDGPAAPAAYQLAYRTVGFRAAETLARARR